MREALPGIFMGVGGHDETAARGRRMAQIEQEAAREEAPPAMTNLRPGIRKEDVDARQARGRQAGPYETMRIVAEQADIRDPALEALVRGLGDAQGIMLDS